MFPVTRLVPLFFFFNDTATTEIYTLSLHDALPISNPGWGAMLNPDEIKQHFPDSYQLWSPFKEDTTYFEPSKQSFMLNLIVADLHALLAELRNEGVEVMEKVEESEFGKFG